MLVPLLLAVVLFAPATLGGRVLSAGDQVLFEPPFVPPAQSAGPANPLQYDAAYVFEPDGLQVREALRAGRLPTWSTTQAAGTPLLAQQQSAPLFPLTWLSVVFPFFGSLVWIAVAKLVLAALGTALFARSLGLRRSACLFAGLSFGFGSYLIDWLMHPHANAYVLLPWLLWLGERLVRDGRLRDAGWLGLVGGLAWLSGQPESALLVVLPAAAWIAYRLVAARPDRAAALRRGGLAAGAGALGVVMGAAMLLPLIEALGQATETSRARPPLPLRSVLTLFAPEWWGRPDGDEVLGPSNFTERTLYAGAIPTLLAAAGLVARRPSGPQVFFAGVAFVAVLVSWDTGPIASLAAELPVLDRINITRALAVAGFALAMLGGFGLHRLLEADAAERRRMLLVVAGLTALPVLALLVAHPSWLADLPRGAGRLLGRDIEGTPAVLASTAVVRWLVLGAAVLALAVALRRRAWVVGAVACALLAADLLAMGEGFNPAITDEKAQPASTPAMRALQELTTDGGRVIGLGGLEPNTASRWGLADARGHEQPTLQRTAGLNFVLGTWPYATPPNAPLDERASKVLDTLGVRAMLLAPPARRAPEPAVPEALAGRRVAYAGPDGTVLANDSALPAAWIAYGWDSAANQDEAFLSVASRPARALLNAPAIETRAAPPAGRPEAATPARIVRRTETSVTLDARATRPGRLVLLDTHYPGWTAEVDGREVDIEAANGAFRSVPVPAGRHRVTFEYEPASVRWGVGLSLLALALLALAVAFGGRSSGTRT